MKNLRCVLLAIAVCALSLGSAKGETTWLTDLSQAQEKAKAENKLLLLDFTGSDWCGWCKILNAEVFSQPAFADYAKKNLVLVTVDFPRAKPQTDALKTQNQTLAQKFEIQGFPTIVILNGDGRPLGMLGYLPGGPDAFIRELKKLPKS